MNSLNEFSTDPELVSALIEIIKELRFKEVFFEQENGYELMFEDLVKPRDKIMISEILFHGLTLDLGEEFEKHLSNWHDSISLRGVRFIELDDRFDLVSDSEQVSSISFTTSSEF